MLVLSSQVNIGKYVFRNVHNITIESSYDTITDTCEITVPRKLSFKGKSLFLDKDSVFNKGDKIEVRLGYGYENKNLVFSGYVTRIQSGYPTKIFCEDDAIKLKETPSYNLSYSTLDVETLLKDILPSGMKYKVTDKIMLGKSSFKKVTASQILNHLRDKYSLKSWFRNDTLYVGLNWIPELQKEHSFGFQKNIIQDNLEFVRAEDIKMSVKLISILPDNSKIEVEAGDKEGTERTVHFYNVDKKTLSDRATKMLSDFKFDGFSGSFTTFGQIDKNFVQHGDVVELLDNYNVEKNGRYIVKTVRRSFGLNGYRQEIEISEKV